MSEQAKQTVEAVERELGVRKNRIASYPGVLCGPPLVPSAAALERLMAVWRFDEPQNGWTVEQHEA